MQQLLSALLHGQLQLVDVRLQLLSWVHVQLHQALVKIIQQAVLQQLLDTYNSVITVQNTPDVFSIQQELHIILHVHIDPQSSDQLKRKISLWGVFFVIWTAIRIKQHKSKTSIAINNNTMIPQGPCLYCHQSVQPLLVLLQLLFPAASIDLLKPSELLSSSLLPLLHAHTSTGHLTREGELHPVHLPLVERGAAPLFQL